MGAVAELLVQRVSAEPGIPGDADFRTWVDAALAGFEARREMVIRVVDADESERINRQYRQQARPTNVLAFPAELDPGLVERLASQNLPAPLGDLVICAPLVAKEAAEQEKNPSDHWAHLVVHGVLHLLGFDHRRDADAREMEARERAILASLGIADPYRPR